MGKHPEYVNGGTNIRLRVDRRGIYLPRSKESQRIGALYCSAFREYTLMPSREGIQSGHLRQRFHSTLSREGVWGARSRPRRSAEVAAGKYLSLVVGGLDHVSPGMMRESVMTAARLAARLLGLLRARLELRLVLGPFPLKACLISPPAHPKAGSPSWRGTGLSLCSPLRVQEKPPYRERWANAPQTFFCTALGNCS